jgi:type II secretion system protein I
MTSRTGNSLRGLTLVEILVSIAILAGATVFVLQALVRGAHALSLARNRMRAYTFASAKMADLELQFRQGLSPDPAGRFRVGRDQFLWRVSAEPSASDPRLERVTLTVSWQQGAHAYATHLGTLRRIPEGSS